MPLAVRLASKVTFLPQFLGVLPKARSPRRDQAYSGESETLAPSERFVHEHQALRLYPFGEQEPPSGSQELVALCRSQRSFFSTPSQPLEHPANGGVADRNPGRFAQELAPLGEGRRRALFEVRFQ